MAASALYACTKCTQRYPFEELSQGQQLCKVRGRRAGGVPLPYAEGLGGRCPAPCLSPSPWGFGSLEPQFPPSLTPDFLFPEPGHQVGKTHEGKPASCPFPDHPEVYPGPIGFRGSRVGLEEADTCLCHRDLRWRYFHLKFSAGSVLSFHQEAGDGFCTFLLGTRSRKADGILPCPGKRSDWFGNRMLYDLELLPSH